MSELKKRLDDKVAQLKSICNDRHFADSLISDILSLKGQMCVEPSRVHIVERSVNGEVDADTFCIYKTNNEVVFHTKGGYTLIVKPGYQSLYGILSDYVDNHDEYDKLEGEEKDNIMLSLSAMTYILELPLYAFSDNEFMIHMATECVKYLREMSEKALNADLQPENTEANEAFENVVRLVTKEEDKQ